MKKPMKLPKVLSNKPVDFIADRYKQLAADAFDYHSADYHSSIALKEEWMQRSHLLKETIAEKLKLYLNVKPPLLFQEVNKLEKPGYKISNILYQTRPACLATASLYKPKGLGPFPAVLVLHGHWQHGRRSEIFQSVAQVLVESGYVVLLPDAWGAGERGSFAGIEEYHGSNLGASLMNVGESLMGMQLTDNIRAIDVLCSLSYVDNQYIGATGANGGGNQTMWLAAMDQRIKASIPVVSVGTFRSYVMNSNCVCELLPQGLTFTEEAAVLGLIAPRALKIFSASKEDNPSFSPAEMLCSYKMAEQFFQYMGADEKLAVEVFAADHSYNELMRESMLRWFDLHLKSEQRNQPSLDGLFVETIAPNKLRIFSKKERNRNVQTTANFCREQGLASWHEQKNAINFNEENKVADLRKILGVPEKRFKKVHYLANEQNWKKIVLVTEEEQSIPLLI